MFFDELNLFEFFPLLSLFFILGLGAIVFLKKRHSTLHRLFFLISIVFSVWMFGTFMMFASTTDEQIIFWDRFVYLGVVFMPAIQYHFSLVVTHTNKKRKNLSIIAYILSLIFLPLSQSDYFVNHIFKYRWGVHTEAQILHHLFLAFFFFYIFALLYNFFIQYKHSDSQLEKYRLKYWIINFSILNLVGGLGYLPAYKISIFSPVSLLAPLTFSILTGYAILRYRLMDIRIVARKIFIYAGVAVFTYGVFYFLIWFYNYIFGSVFSKSAYIAGIFVAPIFVVCFLGLIKVLKIFANKYLFYSLYSYQEAINKLSQELNYYTDLNKIINVIVNSVRKTMQLDRAGVLLISQENKTIHYKIAKVIGFNKSNGISLVQDNFLTKYLEKTQHLLVREELNLLARETASENDKKSFLRLYDHMKKIEASVCLPLLSGSKLIGIIVLGSKISGDAYTKEDLELLDTLTNQAGIAIDNARLYKEIQDFTKTLQNKVDEQTQDIQKTNKKLNNTNKELNIQNNLNKELLGMKSDFLKVVNHQLNTPLSVMRGYFSMLEEGTYKYEQAMPSIKSGLERINQTVEDFWDAYELEGERMKMEPQPVDITEVVDKLIEEKKNIKLAKERELNISVKQPDFKTPPVWCDYKKVVHVISNLLDNAVFYTYKGEVELYYELVGDEYLKINVKDTGSGISKEEMKELFHKFSRGKKSFGMHPDGSGLGLYIAKKIIEGNNGELTVKSEGVDKGSTFSFTLPIYRDQKAEKGKEVMDRKKKMEIF